MTRKTIQRLFPCDTSMVVVIDDRSDVWDWSPNLIKVQQCKLGLRRQEKGSWSICGFYLCLDVIWDLLTLMIMIQHIFAADDFFVGIGDINASFLPKRVGFCPATFIESFAWLIRELEHASPINAHLCIVIGSHCELHSDHPTSSNTADGAAISSAFAWEYEGGRGRERFQGGYERRQQDGDRYGVDV
ncbi:hypothetical protein BC936DRAFT_144095, partial [Jimgerdemannia flammicorona]